MTNNALAVFDALTTFPADFMADSREDTALQEREDFSRWLDGLNWLIQIPPND